MGFDVARCAAVIYDSGTAQFTGTTLEGIGQAVIGVLMRPVETANRFVKVRSLQTCQNELLSAFQSETGQQWDVEHATTQAVIEQGRAKHAAGLGGWILDLVVGQMFEPGVGRGFVASKEESDVDLLEIREETPSEVVAKVMRSYHSKTSSSGK
jgi:hypothetical protein